MKPVHNNNCRGTALVELAMLLPLLVVVFASAVDLGLLLREYAILQNAAREGTRFSALPRNQINPAVNPGATAALIQQRVVDYMAQENITVGTANIAVNQQYPIQVGSLTVRGSEVTVSYSRKLLVAGFLPLTQVTLTGHAIFRNLY